MAPSRNIRAGRAYVEIASDSTKLQRGLREAQIQLKSFGKAAQEVGREMIALSTAMALPFAFATKSFAGFDDSMRLVQAVTQATGEDFANLTAQAQKLGRETSFTAQQVADAMVSLGRMGFSPREIENAISDVLNLARATGTELAEAADFAANSMRIFGIESTEMAHVADVLTVTANSSAQTLTDLFEALKIAGPQANAAGEGIEATSAALGVLANMGIKGSLAGTALRKSYSQFAKLDVQNTLSQWGVSTVDATGNLRKLSEVMVDIAKVMQRMPTAERLTFAEEIFDLRGSLAGLSITANTKALDDFILKLEHVGGVASTTAQKMDAGLGGSFRLLASAAEGSMNAIGDTLSRTLQPMIANMITGLNAFTGWINANGELVTQIAGGIAVVGALGVALLTLGTAAKICGAGVGVLRVATTGVINAWGLMKSAAMGVGNAIALISNAFANYNNTAQPALVSTSRFLAALRLPIDRRANQIAASLILMSNAETAATVKGALAAKWKALTAVLTQANAATIASTVVTKAHTVAQLTAAAATKALTIARTIATAITSKLTLSTLASSAAGAAASAVNTTLAITTKAAAAGYLALNGVMRAFCALPIAAVTMAIVGAIGLFYSQARKASQYTAQLSDSMSKLREEGDRNRKTDALRMQRLVQLSESQKLSNEEIAEAEKLTATLTSRYGDFGASIDAVAGRLNLATDAQDRFNEAMKRVRLQQIRAEIAELQANISELDSEYEATLHWSNYNYLSKLTGNFDETINRQGDIMEKRWAYEDQIRALMFLMDDIEKGVEEVEEEVEATLATSIAEAEQKKLATQEEILAAEKRIGEIETELRRDRQTALENEIEDIKALTDEYVKLQNILIAQAQAKGDNAAVNALEAKIQKAYDLEEARIDLARKAADEERREGIENLKEQMDRDLEARAIATEERRFKENIEALKAQDATAAVGVLKTLVDLLGQRLAQAEADYVTAVSAAMADGDVSTAEEKEVSAAQRAYNKMSQVYERYANDLTNARNAVEEEATKNSGATFGSFYAAAMRGLGVSSYQDKALKASENTAKNTKRTVRLLEDMSKTSIAFT